MLSFKSLKFFAEHLENQGKNDEANALHRAHIDLLGIVVNDNYHDDDDNNVVFRVIDNRSH